MRFSKPRNKPSHTIKAALYKGVYLVIWMFYLAVGITHAGSPAAATAHGQGTGSSRSAVVENAGSEHTTGFSFLIVTESYTSPDSSEEDDDLNDGEAVSAPTQAVLDDPARLSRPLPCYAPGLNNISLVVLHHAWRSVLI